VDYPILVPFDLAWKYRGHEFVCSYNSKRGLGWRLEHNEAGHL